MRPALWKEAKLALGPVVVRMGTVWKRERKESEASFHRPSWPLCECVSFGRRDLLG